jgi:hypothetical protein
MAEKIFAMKLPRGEYTYLGIAASAFTTIILSVQNHDVCYEDAFQEFSNI